MTSDYQSGARAMREMAADEMKLRRAGEQLMRDASRKRGEQVIAEMHSDRAQAFHEAESIIRALPADPASSEGADDPNYKNALVQALKELAERRDTITVRDAEIAALRAALRDILDLRYGPDRAPQWQIDCAFDIAEKAIAASSEEADAPGPEFSFTALDIMGLTPTSKRGWRHGYAHKITNVLRARDAEITVARCNRMLLEECCRYSLGLAGDLIGDALTKAVGDKVIAMRDEAAALRTALEKAKKALITAQGFDDSGDAYERFEDALANLKAPTS